MSSYWGRLAVKSIRDAFPEKTNKVLNDIEALDKVWVKEAPDEMHSYGRMPGEKYLRLWSVPESTGAFLNWYCKINNIKNVFEIGTSAGYSTLWIAEAIKHIDGGGVLTCDIHQEKSIMAKKHIKYAGLEDCVNIENMDALMLIKQIPINFYDMYFFDADKENYLGYLSLIESSSKKSVTVIVDNAVDSGGLMLDFINYMLFSDVWYFYIFDFDNGILVAKKNT